MTDKAGGIRGESARPGKYARVERERRFVPAEPPIPSAVTATRTITDVNADRYFVGTRLRLRRADWPDGGCELKLTQKVPVAQPGAVQGLITNTYLSPTEYDLHARLPATLLSKTRFSVPPLGVDVFGGHLQGLVLAEAEFTTDEEAQRFVPPADCVAEVTDDIRFTGGRLVGNRPPTAAPVAGRVWAPTSDTLEDAPLRAFQQFQ
jgi:hypothetical protein